MNSAQSYLKFKATDNDIHTVAVRQVEEVILNQQQQEDEIGLLIEAMQRGYAGPYQFDPALLSRVFSKLRELPNSDTLDNRVFGGTVGDILDLLPDGHCFVRLNEEILGQSRKTRRRRPEVGANISKKAPWDFRKLKVGVREIAVIGITSFPDSGASEWEGFTELANSLNQFDAVIVDLRGNDGGDDTRGFELAEALVGRPVPFFWIEEVTCHTPEAWTLQENTLRWLCSRNYLSQGKSVPDNLQERLEFVRRNLDQAVLGKLPRWETLKPSKPTFTPLPENAFHGPVHILADAACVSSGESTLEALRVHPRSVFIGEPTGGLIHFGNSGKLILPYSKLEVILCMKMNRYINGAFYEKTGILPDVQVSPGMDAFDLSIKRLKAEFA